MRCLSHCSSSSLFFFSSTGHLLNLALMKISLFYLPQQRYITADAKGVFSLRTVLDWPTFRAVVDSEIAPLFDLFLGLSAWIPVYSLHVEKRYDNQGRGTSATDVIWDLTHVIANIPCMLYPNIFCRKWKNVEASQGWTWNWRLTLHAVHTPHSFQVASFQLVHWGQIQEMVQSEGISLPAIQVNKQLIIRPRML